MIKRKRTTTTQTEAFFFALNRISLKVEKIKKNNIRRASVENCQIVAVFVLRKIHLPLHQSAMISIWVLVEILMA